MSAHAHAVPGASPGPEVRAWKLIATLALGGAVCGLLIVLMFQYTQPMILRNQAAATQQGIEHVLVGGTNFTTLFVHDGKLLEKVPAGVDTVPLEKVYRGFDAEGTAVGYAIVGAEPGFADVIKLIFGYDSKQRRVLGMLVVENKETPGLGDKIVKDSAFVNGFKARSIPLKGVKIGAGTGAEAEVDMITGATISSRIVIGIINHQLERLQPMIEAYESGGGA